MQSPEAWTLTGFARAGVMQQALVLEVQGTQHAGLQVRMGWGGVAGLQVRWGGVGCVFTPWAPWA